MTENHIFNYDDNPAVVEDFDRLPRMFIPGYDASHAMAAVLLQLNIGDTGVILAVGAGGGAELAKFAITSKQWRFAAVDPSEAMLEAAVTRLAKLGAADRLTTYQGTAIDAPSGPFDAATAFLALHFVPDDGQRLEQYKAIHSRLKVGAPFLLINGAADKSSAMFERDLARYLSHARLNGVDEDFLEQAETMQREMLHFVSPVREEALLREAGFSNIAPFYKAFWIEGWEAFA
jgi:tRNA (cmo5U34)-methyltransferase